MADTNPRRKPPRLTHINTSETPLYLVTAVSWRRQRILATTMVHGFFREHATTLAPLGIAIGRYVIMPDHVHFFVRLRPDLRLGVMVKHLKQHITKALRHEEPQLRVWQPGFFDHVLRNDESYADKWEYVRLNPVRKGLIRTPDEWPYQGEMIAIDRA